tara:strand:- start:2 stop:241 length:240 start_codon:yes stop_codon:yes gene_type:complete
MKIKTGDIIILSGKTEFGKSFVKENGTEFEVIKFQTWHEHQLLIKPIKENREIGLMWINVLPESTNFNVYFTNAPLERK